MIPATDNPASDWFPFENQVQFETADFLYRRAEMSGGDIDALLQIWDASLAAHGERAPFLNHRALYRQIDAIPYGDVPWKTFTVSYMGENPFEGSGPSWMTDDQVVWYREPLLVLKRMIANPDFDKEFDYVPYHEYVNGVHQFRDFMSGNWAWKQAVCGLLIRWKSTDHYFHRI